jgi:hypothetical protein
MNAALKTNFEEYGKEQDIKADKRNESLKAEVKGMVTHVVTNVVTNVVTDVVTDVMSRVIARLGIGNTITLHQASRTQQAAVIDAVQLRAVNSNTGAERKKRKAVVGAKNKREGKKKAKTVTKPTAAKKKPKVSVYYESSLHSFSL